MAVDPAAAVARAVVAAVVAVTAAAAGERVVGHGARAVRQADRPGAEEEETAMGVAVVATAVAVVRPRRRGVAPDSGFGRSGQG